MHILKITRNCHVDHAWSLIFAWLCFYFRGRPSMGSRRLTASGGRPLNAEKQLSAHTWGPLRQISGFLLRPRLQYLTRQWAEPFFWLQIQTVRDLEEQEIETSSPLPTPALPFWIMLVNPSHLPCEGTGALCSGLARACLWGSYKGAWSVISNLKHLLDESFTGPFLWKSV